MSKETESSLKGWQKAIQTMSNYRPKKLYVTASYEDFKEGQWWLVELDTMVANGTPDQKRAVVVVRNLMNQFNKKTIDQEHADSMYQGLLKESQASIDMLTAKVKELEAQLVQWNEFQKIRESQKAQLDNNYPFNLVSDLLAAHESRCKDCGGSGYAPPSTDRFLCPACSGKQPL